MSNFDLTYTSLSKHDRLIKASACDGKQRHPSLAEAKKVAGRMARKHGVKFTWYKCRFCLMAGYDFWHVANRKVNKKNDRREAQSPDAKRTQ